MNLPACPACQLVPQAAMLIFCAALNSASLISISSRKTWPVSCEIRPSMVSRTARGCSWISLSMKCLKPPFSAMIGSQVRCCTWRMIGRPSKSRQLHAFRRDHRQVAIGQEEQIAGVVEDRRHIRRHEILFFAQADHGGRAVAGSDDLVGLIHRDDRQREHSGQFLDGFADRFFQRGPMAIAALQEILLDQVRDDFGVGLGRELVSFFDSFFLRSGSFR